MKGWRVYLIIPYSHSQFDLFSKMFEKFFKSINIPSSPIISFRYKMPLFIQVLKNNDGPLYRSKELFHSGCCNNLLLVILSKVCVFLHSLKTLKSVCKIAESCLSSATYRGFSLKVVVCKGVSMFYSNSRKNPRKFYYRGVTVQKLPLTL